VFNSCYGNDVIRDKHEDTGTSAKTEYTEFV